MGLEPRGRAVHGQLSVNPSGEEPAVRPKPMVKSFEIHKRLVFGAWLKVQANGGAPGVDAVSIDRFAAEREGQPLQAVEPDVVGKLLPGTGASRGDTEGSGERGQGARGAERGRPGRSDRGRDAAGSEAGADLPPRQLRLPSCWRAAPITRWL